MNARAPVVVATLADKCLTLEQAAANLCICAKTLGIFLKAETENL